MGGEKWKEKNGRKAIKVEMKWEMKVRQNGWVAEECEMKLTWNGKVFFFFHSFFICSITEQHGHHPSLLPISNGIRPEPTQWVLETKWKREHSV